ncbi:MAG: phosphatase PAP2 family protein [Bdellovibrionota bacterium]
MNFTDRKGLIRHSLILLCITVAGLIASLFYIDLALAHLFSRPELEKVYYYSREITNVGYSIHYFLLALIGIVFSWLVYPRSQYLKLKITAAQNMNIYQWSVFSVRALLFIGISLNILKFIIGRQRPHSAAEFFNLNFEMFTFNSHWHSFPSGHSQVMFTVATIALLIWPKQKYIFLSLAGIFALTRITIHQHFLSDILAGGMIGHLLTLWLYQLWPPKLAN